MKKTFSWIFHNLLFIISLFFLIFIPLYPKFPLLDIQHTWVNIRIEDFLIAAAVGIFGIFLILRKATLKTPLSIPIAAFWLVGLASTIFAILFIFPNLTNVFPHLAFLHYFRHVEYLIVFFIGFNAVKGKKAPYIVTVTLAVIVLAAFFYGLGQKFWGFPAYLTGNEEFSKGIPLRLSENARITSLFAGHYDLSAYIVLVTPILLSFMWGVKKWWARIALFLTGLSGYILLLLTASRVSFAAFLVGLTVMFVFLKKKKYIVPALIAALLISTLFEGMTERFGKTISEVDLVVDARTGQAVGVAEEQNGEIVVEDKTPEGAELKTGTGFINLPKEQVKTTATEIVYKRSVIGASGEEEDVSTIEGDFVVKKGFAYDVSFTTRFQGTWPRAIDAFDRNQLLGSGYSTINLASDNNYLRMLGEIGLLGLASFMFIFVVLGIYIYRVTQQTKNAPTKTFAFGAAAGIVALACNAVLIDVFEASKIAFSLWLLIGLTVGMLHVVQKRRIDYYEDIKKVLLSFPAIATYVMLTALLIFRINFENFFVADDFTWLRWVDECNLIVVDGLEQCESLVASATTYFTQADGFFYRPGTKVYFHLMYSFFSLDANKYHYVSAALHAITAIGLFFLGLKFTKNRIAAAAIALVWAALGMHYEAVFWASVTGHLVAFSAITWSLVFYIYAQKRMRIPFLVLSFISAAIAPLFQEVGIVAPFLLVSYAFIFEKGKVLKKVAILTPYVLLAPIYLYIRYIAKSHWSGGDYSYSLQDLPLNIAGNGLGYKLLTFLGPDSLALYDSLRSSLQTNIPIAIFIMIVALILLISVVLLLRKNVSTKSQKIIAFFVIFYILTLLPFLGFGNIAPRYGYLASFASIFLLGYIIFHGIEKLGGQKKKLSAFTIAMILGVVYMYFQIGQTQARAQDWKAASIISENLLVGFYDHYPEDTEFENTRKLYFVNVPIKYNSAWVFPTGLEDQLYFALPSDNFEIHRVEEVTDELRQQIEAKQIQLFIFNEQGNVEELTREAVPVTQ